MGSVTLPSSFTDCAISMLCPFEMEDIGLSSTYPATLTVKAPSYSLSLLQQISFLEPDLDPSWINIWAVLCWLCTHFPSYFYLHFRNVSSFTTMKPVKQSSSFGKAGSGNSSGGLSKINVLAKVNERKVHFKTSAESI